MRRRLLWGILILLVAASLGGVGCGRSAHNDSGNILSGTDRAQLPDTSPGGNPFLLGSNLGCWGVNGDGSINEPFMTNTGQQNAAKAVIGMMRFPCRTFTDSQIISIVNKIKSQNIEPLVILSATNGSRSVQIATALNGIATYFEFGNENNWFNGWNGTQYASAWKTYVPQIRAAYPGIKIGGPVGSHFDTTGSTYLRDFLTNIKGAGCDPDFISMHVYAEHGEDTSDQAVIDKAHTWGDGIEKMRSDCLSIVGYTFPFAVTEWNWDAAPENTSDSRDDNATFMHDFNFAVLDEWKAHGVWMSCQYDFGAGAGGAKLDMYNKPQYTAFVDWKNANPPGGGNNPPGSFSLTSPANGATGVATNPTLGWGASSGATGYTLVVDDNSNYSSPIFNQNVGNVTAKQVTGLADFTTYYWKVTATNSYGSTPASNNSFNFTTAAGTPPPSGQSMEAENMALTNYVVNTNSSASNGNLIKLSGSGVTGNAVFNFSGATGTYDIKVYYYDENDGACTFNIYVAGTKVGTWVANQNLGSADPVAATRTSRTITGVSIASGAQIKLEAIQNSQEWGRYDNVEITASAPPSPPGSFSLTSPANGATGQPTSPTLSWGASSGATSYTLVVDDQSNYSSPIFNQDVGNVTSKQVTGLANSTTYYWKVTAHNSAGDTAASNNSFSFTTQAGGGTTIRYEGESFAGKNEVKTWPSGYSGTGIAVRWGNGAMTSSVTFSTAGTYSFTVRMNDYNGTQSFTIQLDGVDMGSFSMTTGDKSWKTFTGSFGNVSAGTHTVGINFTSQGSGVNLYFDCIDITGPQ